MPPVLRLALLAAWLPCLALADTVTLRWSAGGLALTGELLSHDDAHYRLATRYGPLTVAAGGVRCEGACPDLEAWVPTLRFTGSPALARVLLPALAEAFAFRHGMRLDRATSDDGRAILTLADRDTGALVARLTIAADRPEAARAALEEGRAEYLLSIGELAPEPGSGSEGLASRLLALDALVPAVSRANPVRQVALADLRAVWSGEIRDWAVLGGRPGPIRLHAIGPAATDALAGPAPASGAASGPNIMRHATPEALARAVAGDAGALGLARLSRIGAAEPLALVGRCGRRLAADVATLKAEDWPLTLPLLVRRAPGREPEIARAFFDWAASAAAERLIARTGLVAPHYAEVPVEAQGARLANAIRSAGGEVSLGDLQEMLRQLEGAQRLTTSFRFREGGTALDAQSRANVDQLARAIGAGDFAGRTMLIVGFTDGEGAASANRRLARVRAEAVREALFAAIPNGAAGPAAVYVASFGEALPMACDDTEWGRQVNRRVEVWLR